MENKLINIGYGNFISGGRMIAIIGPDSAPVKRIIQEARDERRLIDATCGRRTRAVIISDSDHVILSAIQPETITRRFESQEEPAPGEEEAEAVINE
ncbi:MAG: DUF370 domain-containing protein [Clostridia bacterium]|nr:DUF370 domain-containing protein [Clostridia bacterium]